MYITTEVCLGAILPEDRLGNTVIDGASTIMFTRRDYGMYVGNGVKRMTIQNFTVMRLAPEIGRLKRFFKALPMLWKFCK